MQYTAIAKIAVFLLAFIVLSYVMRPAGSSHLQSTGVRRIGNTTLGLISGMCFLVGALCSAAAGYISMCVISPRHVQIYALTVDRSLSGVFWSVLLLCCSL